MRTSPAASSSPHQPPSRPTTATGCRGGASPGGFGARPRTAAAGGTSPRFSPAGPSPQSRVGAQLPPSSSSCASKLRAGGAGSGLRSSSMSSGVATAQTPAALGSGSPRSLTPRGLLGAHGGGSRLPVRTQPGAKASPRSAAGAGVRASPAAASPRPGALPARAPSAAPSAAHAGPTAGALAEPSESLPYSPPSLSPLRTTALARAPPPSASATAAAAALANAAADAIVSSAAAGLPPSPPAVAIGGALSAALECSGSYAATRMTSISASEAALAAGMGGGSSSSRLAPITPAEYGQAPSFLRSQFEFMQLNQHIAQISMAVVARVQSGSAEPFDVWTSEAIAQATGLAPLSGDAGKAALHTYASVALQLLTAGSGKRRQRSPLLDTARSPIPSSPLRRCL